MLGNYSDDAAWKPPPIDVDRVLSLGRELSAAAGESAAPAVPALCLRLARYAASIDAQTAVIDVEKWAASCYEQWLDQLGRNDPQTVQATLETDPANLLLGAQALRDIGLGTECMRAQFALYARSGLTLPRLNQTIISALLTAADPQPARILVCDPLSAAELANQLSPVACVALALAQRSGRLDDAPVLSEDELTAVSLRSVWMRDLAGVGLSLVASRLLFGRAVPDGLIGWISRICRRDGFFGMWELYADPHPTANLLGTVNIYWGLSTPVDGRARRPLAPPRDASVDLERCREAIVAGQSWLDAHEERFQLLPACPDENTFETRFKPLVELALLCYVLTRDRHRAAGSPWAAWARSMAERLFPHVEWEGLMEAFRVQTSATLGLAIYPFLISAAGRPTPLAEEARKLLENPFAQAQERTPMREMDYQFTRHIMGAPGSSEDLRDQLARTVIRAPFDPLLMDTDALYDLTHVVLYATRFGCTPWLAPSSDVDDWLDQTVDAMTLARLLMLDADLGAELLLVQFYTGRGLTAASARCIDRLLDAQAADGAFAGPDLTGDLEEFDANYHTTLVAIAALAEAVCVAARG
jgi:hypothetical protein